MPIRRITAFLLLSFSFVVFFVLRAIPGVPSQISYQGRLTDDAGVPLVDGTYTIRFHLWDDETEGTQIWNEPNGEKHSVTLRNGIYHVQLGSIYPLDYSYFENGSAWLEIAIENESTNEWETLSPRMQITSIPYAMQAENAELINGLNESDFAIASHTHSFSDLTGTATDAQIPDKITVELAETAKDADTLDGFDAASFSIITHNHDDTYVNEKQEDSIHKPMIRDNAVGTDEVVDNSLTASDLSDGTALAEILDDDGPGSGLDADRLDGYNSSYFMSQTTDEWVNESGDTMSGPLTVNNQISTSENYKFITPKTRNLNISHVAFKKDSAYTDTFWRISDLYSHTTSPGTRGSCQAFAQIYLPNGAFITNVEVMYVDNNADQDINIQFYLIFNSFFSLDYGNAAIGSTTSTGSSSEPQYLAASNISSMPVSESNSYFIKLIWNPTNDAIADGLFFYGARVTYTVDQAD